MKIEKIKFERSGGFAGIRLAAEIEVNELPEDQKKEILELLDELDFEELPAKLGSKMPVPDEFVYSIVVESDEREYKVLAGESALPSEMQPLIEILESITKRQMRKNK
ncbi:MAG TPA: protealysin inhibitor emfourin [Anaerolineales bacterium]|nr:protealysin inhibitor emfourin [Anaerolineales bacterium]